MVETLNKLSEEQERIFSLDGHIRIQAFAGTGKSTLFHHYVLRRGPKEYILYLCFNRANNDAFDVKCKSTGAEAEVKTFHSMAYEAFGRTDVKSSYSTHELNDILYNSIKGIKVSDRDFVLFHVNK
ncbi:MAG TPA: hypothetical protein VGQ59_17680, partial [Cyclobacteriaceae bacterium]|nr:hypothetical protein [Cyclobacteriaceae bacterium]